MPIKKLLEILTTLYNQANKMRQRKDVAKKLQTLSTNYLDVAIGLELCGMTKHSKVSTRKSALKKSIQYAMNLLMDDLKTLN